MDHPQGVLRTGDRANVQFEFISQPEFVKEGMKLLFREGKTKVSLYLPSAFEKNRDKRRSGIRCHNEIVVIPVVTLWSVIYSSIVILLCG
jgi:hypothetical protein